jgi:hypothetical protein
MGAQSSTDAFLDFVCANAGDVTRTIAIANTSFFMGLSQNMGVRAQVAIPE